MNEAQTSDFTCEALDKKIQEVIEHIETLKFDKNYVNHQLFIGLSLSIVERTHAILLLQLNQKGFDAEIILRSALEHFVVLKNCTQNEQYYLNLYHEFARMQKRLFEQADQGNVYYSKIAECHDLNSELKAAITMLDTIEDSGGNSKKIQELFRDAEMPDEYESIYRDLSTQVHPTYSGIMERHFKVKNKSELDTSDPDFEVVNLAEPSLGKIEVIIGLCINILDKIIVLTDEFKQKK
jgi:hypothetical protein